jgi:Sulfotransferase family
MELSYTHRYIFIHVYRTGGQSVSKALEPYSAASRGRLARVPILRRAELARLHALRHHNYGHISARELRAALPAEQFGSFFKFAFVRNPWSWLVSVYHYVRQNPDHPFHSEWQSFRSFDHYLDWRVNTLGPELQSEFLCDEAGDLLVDFVGHHETLSEDFARVCERIGIPCSLPHKNSSAHHDFREYYSPDTRALVAEAYRDDIERFGYGFDEQGPLAPILGAHART